MNTSHLPDLYRQNFLVTEPSAPAWASMMAASLCIPRVQCLLGTCQSESLLHSETGQRIASTTVVRLLVLKDDCEDAERPWNATSDQTKKLL
jgi:hypothetical protein